MMMRQRFPKLTLTLQLILLIFLPLTACFLSSEQSEDSPQIRNENRVSAGVRHAEELPASSPQVGRDQDGSLTSRNQRPVKIATPVPTITSENKKDAAKNSSFVERGRLRIIKTKVRSHVDPPFLKVKSNSKSLQAPNRPVKSGDVVVSLSVIKGRIANVELEVVVSRNEVTLECSWVTHRIDVEIMDLIWYEDTSKQSKPLSKKPLSLQEKKQRASRFHLVSKTASKKAVLREIRCAVVVGSGAQRRVGAVARIPMCQVTSARLRLRLQCTDAEQRGSLIPLLIIFGTPVCLFCVLATLIYKHFSSIQPTNTVDVNEEDEETKVPDFVVNVKEPNTTTT